MLRSDVRFSGTKQHPGAPAFQRSGEFWDKERIPKWAIGAGYYCDETYPTHEQIREETIGILKKHPKLNMTIAHIFFLSNADQYDLAEELLETYPNLTFDLCPGWEMYEGMHKCKSFPVLSS